MSTNNQSLISKTLKYLRYAYAFFKWIGFGLVIVLIINSSFLTFFRVDGHSMDTTLHNDQMLPVCLICPKIRTPKLDDVVIVQYEGEQTIRFVKRIVGLPRNVILWQNQSIVLGSDEYFVAGDNRDHSIDSRTYGPIKKSQILGLVLGSHGTGPGPVN